MDIHALKTRIGTAAGFLKKEFGSCRIVIVCGSGMNEIEKRIQEPGRRIHYSEIPFFPVPDVGGHTGNLLGGEIEGKRVVVLSGRAHLYETDSLESVYFPLAVLQQLGMEILVVTNSAGGINPQFVPGDLVIVSDQINLQFRSIPPGFLAIHPCGIRTGRELRRGTYYDETLRRLARRAGGELRMAMREGVYCGVTGPSYETDAEIEMLRVIGVDAVGMSTVHECIFACQSGVCVLGLSLITNVRCVGKRKRLTHDEVLETARTNSWKITRLLEYLIPLL